MRKLICTILISSLYILPVFSQAPDWSWVKIIGSTGGDMPDCVATDNMGNPILAMTFHAADTISVGNDIYINQGGTDIIIIKYDPDGNILWSKSFGGSGYERTHDIYVDHLNNIYLTGNFGSPTISFDTITLLNHTQWSHQDAFVTKLDSNGNVLYAECFGGLRSDYGRSVVADNAGNYYVTGHFNSDEFYIQDTSLLNSGVPLLREEFIAKFNQNYEMEWVKRSMMGYVQDEDMSLSPDGFIYITGPFTGDFVMFDTIQVNAYDNDGIFLAKYTPSGNIVYAMNIADFEGFEGSGCNICNDLDGNILISGHYAGSQFIANNDTLINHGYLNVFISKYESDGTPLWASVAGQYNHGKCIDMTIDTSGHVYITGYFESDSVNGEIVNFGNSVSCFIRNVSNYVAKYSSNGSAKWAISIPEISDFVFEGQGIAIDSSGILYTAGWFSSEQLTVGGQTYYSNGVIDTYFAKLVQPEDDSIETFIDSTNICSGNSRIPVEVNNLNNVYESLLQISFDTLLFSFAGYQNFSSNIQADSFLVNESNGIINIFWQSSIPVNILSDTLIELLFNTVPIYQDTSTSIILNDFFSYYADGSGNMLQADYYSGLITIEPIPEPVIFIAGADTVCQGAENVLYEIIPIQNADSIIWEVTPADAGTPIGTGDSIYIDFSPDFYGQAYITGYGVNSCGVGDDATYLTQVIGVPEAEAGPSTIICQNTNHTLSGYALNYSVAVWLTTGDGSFDDPFMLNATYSPGADDILNGEVYLVLYAIAIFPCTSVDPDTMLLTIKKIPDQPQTPIGPNSIIIEPNLISEYFTNSVDNANFYQWYLNPIEVGIISGIDTNASVLWNEAYSGSIAYINVEAVNGCGETLSDSLLINISPVGMFENNSTPDITIAPNPSSGVFNISIMGMNKDINLSVINSSGVIIQQKKIYASRNGTTYRLDLSTESSGVYYLKFRTQNTIITKKVIVKVHP